MSDSRLPTVSVVTVCRNSVRTIERTIRSVIEQRYPAFEYIIVDGASNDGTLDVIERYRSSITRVISEPDSGVYDAMNKGIALATGEWIHLLNADDRYLSVDSLLSATPHLRADRTNYFAMTLERDGAAIADYRFPYVHWRMLVSAKVPHPAMIVHRDQYRVVGGYDASLRIAADHDLTMRLLKRYPPNEVNLPLVGMDQTGLSARNLRATYREFMEVSIRHGLPRPLAYAIYWLKRVRWQV